MEMPYISEKLKALVSSTMALSRLAPKSVDPIAADAAHNPPAMKVVAPETKTLPKRLLRMIAAVEMNK